MKAVFHHLNQSFALWTQLFHRQSHFVSSSGWNRLLAFTAQALNTPPMDWLSPSMESNETQAVWTHTEYFLVWQQHWIWVDLATASSLLIFPTTHNHPAWAPCRMSCLSGHIARVFHYAGFLVFSWRGCGVCRIRFCYFGWVLWWSVSFSPRRHFWHQTSW